MAKGIAPVIQQYVQLSLDDVASVIDEAIHRALEPLQRELADLKSKGVKYAGVYQRALAYPQGSLVTSDGSMFAAVRDVKEGETPKSGDAWQLCVKAGRDAR
jgi:hypothetical protein